MEMTHNPNSRQTAIARLDARFELEHGRPGTDEEVFDWANELAIQGDLDGLALTEPFVDLDNPEHRAIFGG